MTRLEQQMQFLMEVDKLKSIQRQTYLIHTHRRENDAEHSWHLAIMCMLLEEYSNAKIDKLRVMEMVLIYDIVEIDAGDTYAYDVKGNETKRERELQAAKRLFQMLPEDQEVWFWQLFNEFEEGKTPEAKFANSLDKIQPILLNDANGGISWREHGVLEKQIRDRNKNTPEGSETLWAYAEKRIAENVDKGNIQR